MTNEKIMEIAVLQSSWDINCSVDDFFKDIPVLVESKILHNRKKYYRDPIACNFVSYGSNIVASSMKEYCEIVREYIHKFECYHCFETPNIHWLNQKLEEYGQKVCFMAEYWLPDMNFLKRISCNYELKILLPTDFENLYTDSWSNALCENRKALDVLAVGAYDNGKLIGLAGCSADADDMWQIGVDVLPNYRNQGIAASLVSNLAVEICIRNKVPFYCCAWSNILSAKTAIKAGFRPGWIEMTVKPNSVIDEMNR